MNSTISLTISIFQDNRHIIGPNSSVHFKQRAIEPLLNGCFRAFYVGLMNRDEHWGKNVFENSFKKYFIQAM